MAKHRFPTTLLEVSAQAAVLSGLTVGLHPILGDAVGVLALFPVVLWSWRLGPGAGVTAALVCAAFALPLYAGLGPVDLERLFLVTVGTVALMPTAVGVGVVHDLVHSQAARLCQMSRALAESEFRYRLAAPGESDGLWDWDIERDTVFYSARWKALLGYGPGELCDSRHEWLDRVHEADRVPLQQAIDAHLSRQAPKLEVVHRLRHKDGRWLRVHLRGCARWTEDGRPDRMAGWASDITAQYDNEQQLRREALHDALTGLPNRALFLDRLTTLARGTRRTGSSEIFAVLFLDLDRFKHVNDSLGHSAGDELLISVGHRLETLLRTEDTLARMGGDEFTVLLRDLSSSLDAVTVGNRIIAALEAPFSVAGQELYVASSVGVALGVPGQADPEEMMRNADAAMYQAKESGGRRVRLFDQSMWARAVARLSRETELRAALDRGELRLHYQPIVSLGLERIVGFEALVRWQHPDGHLVPPSEFVPMAEETGLIVQLSQWVIAEATRQLADWTLRGIVGDDVRMSVNLSTRDFTRPELVTEVADLLEAVGIDPERLEFEITESTAMGEPEQAIDTAIRLRRLGVGIALDDFGTGHSSLTYLQRLPVTAIKIDKTFVDHVTERAGEVSIVRSITALARNFGAVAIAEGVETELQAETLLSLGVNRAQGYLFSPPRSAVDTEAFLACAVARSA